MSSNNPNSYHSGDTSPVIMQADNATFNFSIGDLLVFESGGTARLPRSPIPLRIPRLPTWISKPFLTVSAEWQHRQF